MQNTRFFGMVAVLALAGPSCVAAQIKTAHAADAATQAPPAGNRNAVIEVIDSTQGKPTRTSRYSLAVVDERGWAELDARSGTESTHVKVRADRDRNYAVVMAIELHRSDSASADVGLSVNDSTTFFAGRRSVVSKVDRADGTSTEVALVTQ